jgi:hypothetical protein
MSRPVVHLRRLQRGREELDEYLALDTTFTHIHWPLPRPVTLIIAESPLVVVVVVVDVVLVAVVVVVVVVGSVVVVVVVVGVDTIQVPPNLASAPPN